MTRTVYLMTTETVGVPSLEGFTSAAQRTAALRRVACGVTGCPEAFGDAELLDLCWRSGRNVRLDEIVLEFEDDPKPEVYTKDELELVLRAAEVAAMRGKARFWDGVAALVTSVTPLVEVAKEALVELKRGGR